MTTQNQRPSQVPSVTLLTIGDAAARLGCSDTHIYRLLHAGDLRAVDIAGPGARRTKTRVRSDDLAAYVEQQTRARRNAGDAA